MRRLGIRIRSIPRECNIRGKPRQQIKSGLRIARFTARTSRGRLKHSYNKGENEEKEAM